MADLRIVDAPEIPTENITGEEKLPTGGNGNYSISLDSLADYTKTKKDLADNTSVDGKVNGVRQELNTHIEDLLNPHQVTKGQIGLGNVDNTADADKPVSNSTQAAIISAVAPKADKTYVDNQLTLKANKVDVYTKQESSDLVNNSISTALTPVNTSLDLAKRGIVNRYDSSLTYNSGERVVLTNGDIVKSTIDGNTNDPNVDMTGWELSKNSDIKGYTSLISPVSLWEKYVVNGDWSLAFKEMFSYAKSIHPQPIVFVGDPTKTYLLKTKHAGNSVFSVSGNASFHGMGCKFKLNDAFGDFYAVFHQQPQEGWESGEYWCFKDFSFDYNTTNNLKANTDLANQRSLCFFWNARNIQSDVLNVKVSDFLGVWFVTQGYNKNARISHNRIYYTGTDAPNEDRTTIYTGSQSAEVHSNLINSKKLHCHGGIEAHGSNQTICFNSIVGVGRAFHIQADPGIGGTEIILPARNINISNNMVEKCSSFLQFWVFPNAGLKDVVVANNIVGLNSRWSGDVPVSGTSNVFHMSQLQESLENITIEGNTFTRTLNPEDLSTQTRWFSFAGGFTPAFVAKKLKDISIKNNTFRNGIFEILKVDLGNYTESDGGLFNFSMIGNRFENEFNYTGSVNHSAFHFASIKNYSNVVLDNAITTNYRNLSMRSLLEATAFLIDPANDNLSNGLIFKCDISFDKSGMIVPQLVRTHKKVFTDISVNNYLKFTPRSNLMVIGSKFTDKENNRNLTVTVDYDANIIKFTALSQTINTTSPPSGSYAEGSFVQCVRGGLVLGFSCRYSGGVSDYDWATEKVVSRGDYIKIDNSVYVAVTSGALSATKPTAGTVDIIDNNVSLIYVGTPASFETVPKVKTSSAISDNSISLVSGASLADVIAAVNQLATQDNAIKSRLRLSNVIQP